MSVRHLDRLFRPRSVAVFGASDRAGSVGAAVMHNLLAGGFAGALYPVNPKHRQIQGLQAFRNTQALPETPDLAVLCTPPASIPGLIEDLGARGTRAAIVITAGFKQASQAAGRDLEAQMLAAAGRHGLRILGPNCVGLIVPALGLNASFAPDGASPGSIAFVTQSGALATTVLDWASERRIGFSCFVSMGNCLDVDIGDVIDYLGSDADTRAILLYMESLREARKFMSAARAAARNKPLIIVKAGRVPEGAKAAASHTGALAGSDVVYDAAIRRAGALRVYGIEDLFTTAEVLGRSRRVRGARLAILTNGGGPGILATDALIERGGELAELSPATLEALDSLLPGNWSRGNPLDIIGDASPQRYRDALGVLLEDRACDAVLIVHAPTALAASPDIADALAEAAAASRKPVLGCWLGGASAREAARRFAAAGLPSFDAPEDAVAAFMRMLEYRANQESLTEMPETLPGIAHIDADAISEIITTARGEGRRWLSEVEAKQVFSAYGIPVVETRIAASAEEAVRIAGEIGFPVALKVLSPDITHKSDVGGVVLDLDSAETVREAAEGIARRVAARSDVRLQGFAVQAMARRPGAFELIIGSHTDPIFGPVLLFGQGGTGVEVIRDSAIALPPLNMALARQLVERTRISRLLAGYRQHPAARIDLICETLVRISRLVADLEDVASLDINPLIADAEGVLALDARIELRAPEDGPRPELAISPYPAGLEEHIEFEGQAVVLRPIRPEDEPAHREFFEHLQDEDIRFRFFGVMKVLEHSQLARYTQIDYNREMAFIATETAEGERTLGAVRAVTDPDRLRAEFAIIVRSDIKGRGLGRILLEKLIRYCRDTGVGEVVGQVLQDNHRMLALARDLGFTVGAARQGIHEVTLRTGPAPAD